MPPRSRSGAPRPTLPCMNPCLPGRWRRNAAPAVLLAALAPAGCTLPTAACGVLFLTSRTVQLDARVGFGLDDEADDFFTGFGISFLF